MSGTETFRCERHGAVAVVVFAGLHHANALSRERMRALTILLRELEADASVLAVVLRAEEGMSFSVGCDFNETRHFTDGTEVDDWTDDIADVCVAGLAVTKPTVAALDGHVIGVGLLIALACDYHVGSESCSLRMPHFRLGIAGILGGYVLERTAGRHVMQQMLMTGESWSPEAALADGLLHEVVPDKDLAATALKRAEDFATYSGPAFRSTKHFLNQDHIHGLRKAQHEARISNRAGFAMGLPQRRMRTILGQD
ncbi:enoyl-CoA hydratase/isomerase family protein [Streptomyces sp. NPDC014006]|uniref:enoyl-CoA hydratase/isomerase family protein n=1 Tax=Streptomyces sp. NPDC014006 TaxID=3364870 RepID=UPI0036FE7063